MIEHVMSISSARSDGACLMRPNLRFPIHINQEKLQLLISTYDDEYRFAGIVGTQGAEIIRHINSGFTVGEIADITRIETDTIVAFVNCLIREGLAIEVAPKTYAGAQIASTLRSFYNRWNDQLFTHPLWQSLSNGTAHRSVIDGWLIETYHFIRGANARLPYAIAHTSDLRVRDTFIHHYIEEYDHYKFFADALIRRHISPEQVELLGPLPGTRAVINWMRYCARLDFLAYAACSGLLESTGTDSSRARSFYQTVASHYDTDQTGFVDPLINHVDLDEGYGHGNVMVDIFNPIPQLTSQRADLIIQLSYQFVETLMQWFADIETHYLRFPYRTGQWIRTYRSNPTD